MKTTLLSILCILAFQYGIAQNQNSIQAPTDTLLIVKETNLFQDTLWVMDSSQTYYALDRELYLSGDYKVLARDDQGNKLTAINRLKDRYTGLFENNTLDSVTYFGEGDKVKSLKTYGWNVLDRRWMDNVYQLYDENHKLLDSYDKSWNRSQFEYGTGNRATNEYENGLLISSVRSTLPFGSVIWEPTEKTTHIINESGLDSIRLLQKWNQDTEQWEIGFKYETYYIDSLHTIDYYDYIWDSTASYWLPANFTHQVSLENGLRDTTDSYKWDSIGNNWKIYYQSAVLFNESHDILEFISRYYNDQNNSFVNHMKVVFTYETLNQRMIQYKWDTLNNQWRPEYKSYHSYVYDNVPDTTQFDKWDTIQQNWEPIYRIIALYDVRQNQIEDSFQGWRTDTETWETNSKNLYFWSPYNPQSVADIAVAQMKVYPNPARDYVIFKSISQLPTNLFIYNSSGTQVGHLFLNSSPVVWNTSGLAPGMYIYKGEQNGRVVNGKVVLTGE